MVGFLSVVGVDRLRYLKRFYLSASDYDAATLESSSFWDVLSEQYPRVLRDVCHSPSCAIGTVKTGATDPSKVYLGGSDRRLSDSEVDEALHCSIWREKGMHYAVSFANELVGNINE